MSTPAAGNEIYHVESSSNINPRQGTLPHLRARNEIIRNFFDENISERVGRARRGFVTSLEPRHGCCEYEIGRIPVRVLIVGVKFYKFTRYWRKDFAKSVLY